MCIGSIASPTVILGELFFTRHSPKNYPLRGRLLVVRQQTDAPYKVKFTIFSHLKNAFGNNIYFTYFLPMLVKRRGFIISMCAGIGELRWHMLTAETKG